MIAKRYMLLAVTVGLCVSACETTGPECREATAYERSAFGAIIAHDEDRLASMMAPGAERDRLSASDPNLEAQLFGQRMGDPSVRTVVMQPPLCVYDERAQSDSRISYIFANGRYDQLQDAGVGFGEAGRDHARCRYELVNGEWKLADACVATFQAPPAS
jgi:hypothetical protein